LPDKTNFVYHRRLSIPQIFILYRQWTRVCQSYWIYNHNFNSILRAFITCSSSLSYEHIRQHM